MAEQYHRHALDESVLDQDFSDSVVPSVDDERLHWLCPRCAAVIGTNEDGQYLSRTTKTSLPVRTISPQNEDPHLFVDPEMVLRVHSCASCGCWVETYIALAADDGLTPTMHVAGYRDHGSDGALSGRGGD
jgi:hypothetical protein